MKKNKDKPINEEEIEKPIGIKMIEKLWNKKKHILHKGWKCYEHMPQYYKKLVQKNWKIFQKLQKKKKKKNGKKNPLFLT